MASKMSRQLSPGSQSCYFKFGADFAKRSSVLQLANLNTKLESILDLELLERKVGGDPLHINATASNFPVKEDRMDRLEKMVANLTASVSELTSAVGSQRKSRPKESTVCKHCQKPGHQ